VGGVTLPLGEVLASYQFDSAGAFEGRRSPPEVRQEMEAATEPPDFAGVRAPALAIYADHRTPQDLAPWLPDDSASVAVFEDLLDRTAAERGRVAAAIFRLTVVMRRNHHYQFLSEPDWTGAAIRSFLAGVPAAAPSPHSEANEEPVAADPVVPESRRHAAAVASVVHVVPPTGDRETDRASILAALGDVEPGGTVQFAPGTYLMGGQIIRITVPRVTLAGHPAGTTLRGCHPDEFPMENTAEFGNSCNGIELAGGWQTIRNLTIEHAFWALHVGCCWDSSPHMMPGEGGHLIEGNTFRSNSSAVRVHGYWSEPTVIRNNRILNNWHSVAIYGNTVHLLDNDISAPEPEAVPGVGFPADGIFIAWPPSLHESAEGVPRTCDNNVVSGNRIDGVTEGIMMGGADPQIICRNNIIRDNTIIIRRARPAAVPGFIRVHDEADSTVVGVPLALRGGPEDNLIEGNVIQGAEGLGTRSAAPLATGS
jgi:hypothetical protein